MKVWYGYGSEHSANLVIIGSFESDSDASAVENLLQEWTVMVEDEPRTENLKDYSNKMLAFISKHNIGFIGPSDSEELRYEYGIKREKSQIIIKTEEMGISAFIKAIIWKGGKVEVYSAHDYPNTPYGRGKG